MKKLFILGIFISFSTLGLAQETVSFGLKGGVNFANFGGRDFFVDQETRTGFHFGGFVNVSITDKFSLQPEILYSQQGSTFEFEFQTTTGPSDPGIGISSEGFNRYEYITIPALALYEISPGLSLGGGPQLGINIKAESELTSSVQDILEESVEDLSDITETLDLGIAFNAQYDFPFGILVQARYVLGLSNIDSTEIQEGGANEDPLQNRIFQLSVGYKF